MNLKTCGLCENAENKLWLVERTAMIMNYLGTMRRSWIK
jgi:hypothetical protein